VPYDSIVCVKQVPDTANVTADAMTEDGTVNRSALPAIFNPEDLHALEAALELRDRAGGTVTVICMGPPKAGDVLRDCLYRGVDRAILITDRRAAASDTLATSYILSQAIRTVGKFDIVFCGRQAIDGDTAQVGPQCAEKLDIPQVTYLEEIVGFEGDKLQIRRDIGHGWEVVEATLPILATVVDTANSPRPQKARKLMRYKKAKVESEINMEIRREMTGASPEQIAEETTKRCDELKGQNLLMEQWDLDSIGAELDRCGVKGSPTKVFRIQSIVLTKEGFTEIQPTEEGVSQMIHELVVDRTLG
jgi:electron transfer flavoprotein beta subunit